MGKASLKTVPSQGGVQLTFRGGFMRLGGVFRAADPVAVTPEQHRELQQKALALTEKALQLYSRGQYAKATEALREAPTIRKRLYSPDQYPHGHTDLAVSFHNLGFLLKVQADYVRAEPL